MCGIVGVFTNNDKAIVSEPELIAMRDTMVHRGPDDKGIHFKKTEQYFLGMAHRRLSILDLSPNGRQPMSIDSGRYIVVFNGEIFNFKELREELKISGSYIFKSDSDTEVLLYSIKEWGLEGALERFRGMYAFALFDSTMMTLTLVRDPLGVKPLYYYQTDRAIVFASEIKAILSYPFIDKQINEISLYHYLTFANSPSPHTFFKGIQKLQAGTYLQLDLNWRARSNYFWDPSLYQPDTTDKSESEYTEELLTLLRQSVERRMVSDVPFGVFLSGGVDSSLNVALMAEKMNRPVDTYSVGIKEDPSNEFMFARQVAKHFGTNHHEILLEDDDFINFLPKMPYYQDEPLADPVCIPLHYVSKLARESGTIVIQVGEGSDEIFAGYNTYHFFNRYNRFIYQPFLKSPYFLKQFFSKLLNNIVPAYFEDALNRACSNLPLFLGNAIAFWDVEKNRLLQKKLSNTFSSHFINDIFSQIPTTDSLLRIINVELKNRLPELLLMRVDKMSMANSIETRVPFLDEDLVRFALTIPSALKQKNGQAKYILKKAAEGILPNDIIYRKKHGFCGSATNILTERIAQYAHKIIKKNNLINEFFNQGYISIIFENYSKSKRFNSFKIWNLLNLALWYDQWF